MDVGCGGKPRLSAQVEIIFFKEKKLLVKAWKTWYDNSNEANSKAGHGRFALTHAPMQERPLLHNSICYASSYYNSLPIFFQ